MTARPLVSLLALLGLMLAAGPPAPAAAQSFTKLTVSDAAPDDLLGGGIVRNGLISISENRILVGKPYDDDGCSPGPDHLDCN